MDVFKSRRLVYQPMEDSAEDREFFQKEIWNDPLIMAYGSNSMLRLLSKQKCNERITGLLTAKNWLACLICLPSANDVDEPTPIGFIMLSDSSTEHIRIGTVSICIISKYQGLGYGSETMRWVIDWAFSFANLHRLQLTSNSFNAAAIHIYKRCGFVEEGRKREAVYFANQYYDLVEMGILRREWMTDKETTFNV